MRRNSCVEATAVRSLKVSAKHNSFFFLLLRWHHHSRSGPGQKSGSQSCLCLIHPCPPPSPAHIQSLTMYCRFYLLVCLVAASSCSVQPHCHHSGTQHHLLGLLKCPLTSPHPPALLQTIVYCLNDLTCTWCQFPASDLSVTLHHLQQCLSNVFKQWILSSNEIFTRSINKQEASLIGEELSPTH